MTAVRPPATDLRSPDAAELADTAGRLLGDDWQVVPRDFWCTARPSDAPDVAQGWKIHVSATPGGAADVLAAAVPVLREHHTPFKFACDVAAVRWLTGRDCERALAGKFLTVYPADDQTFVRLAAALHDAVGSMPGPRILSDRPYLPGSSVYYRYGGFRGDGALDSDGVYRYVLHTPDGGVVEDRREAWFDAPSWAPCPLEQEQEGGGEAKPGKAVLLGDRYVVRAALRHSAKGGVYLATDSATDTDVVVKHARAEAELDSSGHDARDLLRNEADVLRRLAGVVPVPRLVQLFEQDGDVFLAEERLPGRPLRSWVHGHSTARPGVPAVAARPVVRGLLDVVAAVHGAGLVLRDLSPTNVLVTDAGDLHLVDLELATPDGAVARRSGTPAYQAPERRFGAERAAAAPAEDLYSLGALLFLVGTGCDPLLPDHTQRDGSKVDQLLAWFDLVADHGETAQELRPLVYALLTDTPADRPPAADLRRLLDDPLPTPAPHHTDATRQTLHDDGSAHPTPAPRRTDATPQPLHDDGSAYRHDDPHPAPAPRRTEATPQPLHDDGSAYRLDDAHPTATPQRTEATPQPLHDDGSARPAPAPHQTVATPQPLHDDGSTRPAPAPRRTEAAPQRLLGDGIAYLLASMTPDRPRLWPSGRFGRQTDAGNVQHGAAGVLLTLVRTLAHAPDPDAARRSVQTAADWLATQRPPRRPDRPLPGLYFGRAGVAWALAEAGAALDDGTLTEHAVEQALRLPTAWPNPDVAHGLAGACLAHLRLAQLTGDERLRTRAEQYADTLAAVAGEDANGPCWRIPRDMRSVLAGQQHHGFAHGTAGVAYALLATGREQDVALATRAGDALCTAAQRDEHGTAWWPVGPDDPTRLPHWCSGSSGIGSFLVRLYARTGEQRFADHAAAAAVAVHGARWQSSPVACHGLAGDGQFLLDAAELLVDPTYHDWAADLGACLAVRHCERDGLLLTADESGRDVVADHQVGTAGVVAFLARLLHGGTRVLMPDEEGRC